MIKNYKLFLLGAVCVGLLIGTILGHFLSSKRIVVQDRYPAVETQAEIYSEKSADNFDPPSASSGYVAHSNRSDYSNNYQSQKSSGSATTQSAHLPSYAQQTLDYITQNGSAPNGYVGGRVFSNREGNLPSELDGKTANYREWDVHPKEQGQNRGTERLVTTSDFRHAFFTNDHYRTFQQIR